MPLSVIAIGLSLLGGLGGLAVAGLFLLFPSSQRTRFVPWLVSYAVGVMLGVTLLAILPQAVELLPPVQVFGTLLVGILLFFMLEKLVVWRHCHTHECEVHEQAATMVLIGDAFHNFVDGALIGAAVLTSVPLGISTAIAVAAHEIPQEVGDFAILLHSGYSRTKALLLNALSGLASTLGALVTVFALPLVPALVPYALSLAAASFLYVSMADLIPGLHRTTTDSSAVRQVALVGLGVLTILLLGHA
ncbi:MAG: ZIP family metal transporter [Vicinamibacterales bacterium]